ncbi:MAG: DUF805 domain-containing protein [Caulobacteraceae bacterium]
MYGRLDLTELFFSSAGRLSRAPFLIAAAVLLGAAALYESVASPGVRWVTGWVVYPFLVFCGVSVIAKRLHDRGRSGWWAALVLVAVIAVWTPPQSYADFLFSLVLIWAAIELGAMPGEQGANRFGPNPLRPAHA